jgi:hypothetical protein
MASRSVTSYLLPPSAYEESVQGMRGPIKYFKSMRRLQQKPCHFLKDRCQFLSCLATGGMLDANHKIVGNFEWPQEYNEKTTMLSSSSSNFLPTRHSDLCFQLCSIPCQSICHLFLRTLSCCLLFSWVHDGTIVHLSPPSHHSSHIQLEVPGPKFLIDAWKR